MGEPLNTSSESVSQERGDDSSIPVYVDWLVGGGLALLGSLLAIAGGAILAFVDRGLITDAVTDFGTRSMTLTEAESIDVAVPTIGWTGIGLLATGILLVAGAVAYVGWQRRVRHRTGVDWRPNHFWANAITGAVASIVLSFVPFSQALGGAVAGYLEEMRTIGSPVRAGAAAGLLGAIPAALIVPFVLGGLTMGALEIGAEGFAIFIGGIVVIGLLFAAAFATGIGALGGYVASRL